MESRELVSEGSTAVLLAEAIRGTRPAEGAALTRTAFLRQRLQAMTEQERTRFEFFMRSHLHRLDVAAILGAALPEAVITEEMSIVAGSLAKLFVGEVMQTALGVMKERGETGRPVQREHLREAYRRMRSEGKVVLSLDRATPPFGHASLPKRKREDFDDAIQLEGTDDPAILNLFQAEHSVDENET